MAAKCAILMVSLAMLGVVQAGGVLTPKPGSAERKAPIGIFDYEE